MIDHLGTPRARSGWAAEATRLDQMIYSWSRRSRTSGESHLPAASSLGSTVTRSWSGLLAGEVELDESRVPHPPSALTYIIRSPDHPETPDHLTARDPRRIPEAALVHRIRIPERGGESRARLRAHILIGRADYLTERVRLALYAAGGVVVGSSRTVPRLAPLPPARPHRTPTDGRAGPAPVGARGGAARSARHAHRGGTGMVAGRASLRGGPHRFG
ncbi:hypothetical protein [Frankia sp. CcWB3]